MFIWTPCRRGRRSCQPTCVAGSARSKKPAQEKNGGEPERDACNRDGQSIKDMAQPNAPMKESWVNHLKLGIVHFMAYPQCLKGEGPIQETLEKIVHDDFFEAVELGWI